MPKPTKTEPPSTGLSQPISEIKAELFKALAHPARIRILEVLADGERSVSELVTELEGGAGTVLCPSGLSAISTALLSVLEAGDHLLITDSAYAPTRRVANSVLSRLGIRQEFYDPRIGAGIAELFTDKTRAVFVESPGSLTFEIQDLQANVDVAKAHGAYVIVDNSWATPM